MIRSVVVAFSFLTRLPIKLQLPADGADVAKAAPYFGLVGAIVGSWQGLVYGLVGLGATPLVASVVSVVSAVLVTGAFHYDGLADASDAFVGGWNSEQRREILKDSRLGTYGVMALVLVVILEVALVAALDFSLAFWGLLSAHTVSRTASVTLGGLSRKSVDGIGGSITGKISGFKVGLMIWAASAIGVGAGVASGGSTVATLVETISLFGVVAVATCGLGRYAFAKVGVVNGDTLGAVERICYCIYLFGWVTFHT